MANGDFTANKPHSVPPNEIAPDGAAITTVGAAVGAASVTAVGAGIAAAGAGVATSRLGEGAATGGGVDAAAEEEAGAAYAPATKLANAPTSAVSSTVTMISEPTLKYEDLANQS